MRSAGGYVRRLCRRLRRNDQSDQSSACSRPIVQPRRLARERCHRMCNASRRASRSECMDPQKSAASRVRHILHAMERSIDAARSRRVGPPAGGGAYATPDRLAGTVDTLRQAAAPAASASTPTSAAPSSSLPVPRSNGQLMIGAPAAAATTQVPVTRPAAPQLSGDGQPPRLKAKPKRFEGNVNSAFAPPPAYRSQAG